RVLPDLYKDAISHYVLSLFSVHFAPLWTHATKTLITLSQFAIKNVWPIFEVLFAQLSEASSDPPAPYSYLQPIEEPEPVKENNKRNQPLVSYECTHLKNLQLIWAGTTAAFDPNNMFRFVETILSVPPSVDLPHYYTLLVKFLGQVPHLLLDKSSVIVPHFLKLFHGANALAGIDQDVVEDETSPAERTTKQAKAKVLAFLVSFALVTKPRRLFKSDELYTTFLRLLTNGDARIQKAALECIFTWQHPGVAKYSDRLVSLVQDESMREGLAVFDMDEMRTAIPVADQRELLQVICRILYGKLITRHGRNSKAILRGRNTAIFGFLSSMNASERDEMVSLMLEPFSLILGDESGDGPIICPGLSSLKISPLKKQLGFLNVVEDFVKQLRTLVVPSISRIMRVLLNMLHYSDALVEKSDEFEAYIVTQSRQVRLLALKRITLLFSIDCEFDFTPFISQLYASYINSRVERLETENTQAPSALLDLFAVWSRDSRYINYLAVHPGLITALLSICTAKKVQESVILHILSLIENIQNVHDSRGDLEILPRLLYKDIPYLLQQFKHILTLSIENRQVKLSTESISNRIIRIVARISKFVDSSDVAESLLSILVPFLKSSTKAVPETTKTEILRILRHFLPLLPNIKSVHPSETIYYSVVSQLFSILEGREARQELLLVFRVFADLASDLERVYAHLADLNAMSTRRIDEADFDRRFAAFSRINQHDYLELSLAEWRPILHNHFFCVGDVVEYSIRTSAAFGISRFIENCANSQGEVFDARFNMLQHIVLPQAKKGFKLTEELVRVEWIKLWGQMVQSFHHLPSFQGTKVLLGVDEENNFFLNITHLQVHRRVKALRQVSANIRDIAPSSVTHLISIISHFVYNSDRQADHNIINESMASIAACCEVLSWGQYYGCIKRFMSSIKIRPELEKVLVRLIVLVLDKFHFSGNQDAPMPSATEAEEDLVAAIDDEQDDDPVHEETQTDRIHAVVTSKLIPSLQAMLAVKNDETLSVRTPLAIAITKLLKQLSKKALESHLPKLLITLCNFLSSHLQSSRDSARATLVTISTMIGAEYLSYILSSLKTALTRGYQLHVLGYTLHAIMVANTETYACGSIDSCVRTIVEIAMHDIFGETGKEREVQELKGKMREIKTTKSYETLECLSRIMSFGCLPIVLLPLKEQMLETNDVKIVKQIEEVFRRLALG
ncbi:U3 snoRNP protein, partial [Kappamyces sp. JEL0680]